MKQYSQKIAKIAFGCSSASVAKAKRLNSSNEICPDVSVAMLRNASSNDDGFKNNNKRLLPLPSDRPDD